MSPAESNRPTAGYEGRVSAYTQLRDADAERAALVSHCRLAVFLGFIASAVMVEQRGGGWWVAVVLTLAAFVGLYAFHQRLRRRMAWNEAHARVNQAGLARLRRDWAALPSRAATTALEDHPYARDLDVFGRGALVQVLGPASTPQARRTLEHWLLSASQSADIRQRQEAARELAWRVDERDAIAVRAMTAGKLTLRGLEQFLSWCSAKPVLLERRLLVSVSRILPAITVSLMIADGADWLDGSWWFFPLIGSLLVLIRAQGLVRSTFTRAFASERLFDGVPELLGAITALQPESPLLQRLRGTLVAATPAQTELQRLFHLSHLSDLPRSSVGALLNIILLWDLHVLHALERWQVRAGSKARAWFAAAGEIEALCALGALAHDHPEWSFPEIIDGGGGVFEATSLGHPLLRDDARVDNDIVLGPAGTFVLLTGSNMSGKSTLLRSIGVNVVLAQAGAPVCAARLRMSRVSLQTSVRTQDSLVEGVSLFMAELRRTRQIIDAARESGEGVRVLFLLDELLQGTNTAERRIASQRILQHLLDAGACGAVSTHDLTLLEGSAVAERATLVHFVETLTGQAGAAAMTFDYTLRPGLATSTNALKLMEILGLGDQPPA